MPTLADPLRAPLTFEPQLRDYVWGGRNLERLFGRSLPEGVTAESWEMSAHSSAPTLVDGGPLAGTSLPELVARYRTQLTGRRAAGAVERGSFPLLFKLLDANQPLSVQVHPSDAHAAAGHSGETGKTEMWYVLHAEPGAEVILGVTPGTDAATLRQAASEGRIEERLNRVAVRPGDAVLVPAGTVHAILPGVVLAEIQQSSDATYRLYDWGRPCPEDGGRELHVEQALAAACFGHDDAAASGSLPSQLPGVQSPVVVEDREGVRRELLAACDKFVVERVALAPGAAYHGQLDGETFEAWGVVSGAAEIAPSAPSARPRRLEAVRFALLPATMGAFRATAAAATPTVALRTYLPQCPARDSNPEPAD